MKIRMATRDIKTRKNIISGFRTSFLKKILQNQKLFDQFFLLYENLLEITKKFSKEIHEIFKRKKISNMTRSTPLVGEKRDPIRQRKFGGQLFLKNKFNFY